MTRLVLLRHGESVWNKENRFTGWTDVDLSDKGMTEAKTAGQKLLSEGYVFDLAFTSVLKRAVRTLWMVLDEMDLMWITVYNSWRLNERHYGGLGIASAWHSSRLAGLVPLTFLIAYDLSNALARTSGSRYLVPTDWVLLFYFALGIIQICRWIGVFLRNPLEPPLEYQVRCLSPCALVADVGEGANWEQAH